MNLPRKFLEQFIEDLNNKTKLGNGTQAIPSDIENNDWKFLYLFWKLFNDRRFIIDNGNEENVDWENEDKKNIRIMLYHCYSFIN